MQRYVFLVPGFFGFANLGDFTYWGRVVDKLDLVLDEQGTPAELRCVRSLPTASLRDRTRALLEAIAAVEPGPADRIHLVGHSTGGLDARLLLTPAVDLETTVDTERYAALVRSATSVATPHRGAPIASFFTSLAGRRLLQLLSVMTMAALRGARLPLSMWASTAGLFAVPKAVGLRAESLPAQLYKQVLSDFTPTRQAEVRALLEEVERDQSLLTQLTVETVDVFNAAAGDRPGVAYGSVVTRAREPSLRSAVSAGLDPVENVQLALYMSLRTLSTGYDFPTPDGDYLTALAALVDAPPSDRDTDGIVPTLSQPWGRCIAAARADHLDIIGHFRDPDDPDHPYDWLATNTGFTSGEFDTVWRSVAAFIADSEE